MVFCMAFVDDELIFMPTDRCGYLSRKIGLMAKPRLASLF
jgi:hypothetical protein